MDSTPQNTHTKFSEVWKDDQRMDVLFSPFRQNREVNPHSWDSKLKFWTQTITQNCRDCKSAVINLKTLPPKFKRNGKQPVCLQQVLEELSSQKKIMSVTEFQKIHTMGWVSWGFDLFVKKPVCWTLGSMMKGGATIEGDYVVMEVVNEMAVSVLKALQGNAKIAATDYVIDYSTAADLCKPVCSDETSLHLVFLLLVKERKATILEKDGKKIVKFVRPDINTVSAISEVELGILRLKKTKDLLEEEVETISSDTQRSLQDAKYYISKGLKNSAKNALKRKKLLERKLDQKECSLHTLTTLLEKIQDSDSDKRILDAYDAGVKAMKQSNKEGPNVNKINETMDSVQEVLEDQTEIMEALSTTITDPSLDVSEADLLSELEQILADDQEETKLGDQLTKLNLDSSFPKVPTAELPAVPDNIPSPRSRSSKTEELNATFTADENGKLNSAKEVVHAT